MTKETDQVTVVKKIIVYFDICSSTSILEELLRTENNMLWRNLIIDLKRYLKRKQSSVDFELYKFLGDGWILLFEPCSDGLVIFEFLEELLDEFVSLYRGHINNVLSTEIPVVGITFGMDIGSCIKFVINKQPEYVGRPLNIAGRLQGAVGQHGEPQNKGLVSKNLFATFRDQGKIRRKYKVWKVGRKLKNISGGEDYRCLKVELKRHPSN